MKKLTQHEAIVKYLQLLKGWVPGYRLSKVELCGVWVGSRGERSARDLVGIDCPKGLEGKVERVLGKAILEWTTEGKDAGGKPIEERYAYYRAIPN